MIVRSKLQIVRISTHIEHGDVEDHQVKGKRESHCHEKVNVDLVNIKFTLLTKF